ncbi:MAG: hypothetical protein ACW992_08460 [Candidatus Thorarchaeota archaeon]|jgi:hypothetical protein
MIRILPLISFVWLGVFLMVAAIFPMVLGESSFLMRNIRLKGQDLFGEDEAEEVVLEAVADS